MATFDKGTPETEELLPLEEVETPHTATIADLAALLDRAGQLWRGTPLLFPFLGFR